MHRIGNVNSWPPHIKDPIYDDLFHELFVLDSKGDFSVEFKKTQNGPSKFFIAFFLLIIIMAVHNFASTY